MNKHKVSIVGEDRLLAHQLGGLLSKEKFSVIGIAVSVEELIPLLLEEPPEAVLLDVSSEAVSKWEELAKAVSSCVDIPVVLLAAKPASVALEKMKELAIAACIFKPLDVGQLEVSLALAIHQHERSREGEEQQELEKIGYSISHTFRGPVASILGLTNICRLDVKHKKALWINGMVEKKARQIDELLANYFHYLKLKRYSGGVFRELSLEQFIKERLLDLAFADKNNQYCPSIRVKVRNSYLTDPFLLTIVFNHILKNSLDYKKGKHAEVAIDIEENQGIFEIKILDKGIGMSETIQQKCFDLFFRGTEYSVGNGIGLNLVRTAVEKLGGSLKIESIEQEGSCFTLLLPNLKRVPVLESKSACLKEVP